MARAIQRIQESVGIKRAVDDPQVAKASERLSQVDRQVNGLIRRARAYISALASPQPVVQGLVSFLVTQAESGPDDSRTHYNTFASAHEETDVASSKRLKEVFEEVVMHNLGRWRETVTNARNRINELETQRMEVDHYRSKVQNMRESLAAQNGKGRQPSTAQAGKLQRNEQKHAEAVVKHRSARDEALTAVYRVWSARHAHVDTMLLRLMQFEQQRAKIIHTATSGYTDSIRDIKSAVKHRGESLYTGIDGGHFVDGRFVMDGAAARPSSLSSIDGSAASSSIAFDTGAPASTIPPPSSSSSGIGAAVSPSDGDFDDFGFSSSAHDNDVVVAASESTESASSVDIFAFTAHTSSSSSSSAARTDTASRSVASGSRSRRARRSQASNPKAAILSSLKGPSKSGSSARSRHRGGGGVVAAVVAADDDAFGFDSPAPSSEGGQGVADAVVAADDDAFGFDSPAPSSEGGQGVADAVEAADDDAFGFDSPAPNSARGGGSNTIGIGASGSGMTSADIGPGGGINASVNLHSPIDPFAGLVADESRAESAPNPFDAF